MCVLLLLLLCGQLRQLLQHRIHTSTSACSGQCQRMLLLLLLHLHLHKL
jgi:hypothetical protein